MTQTVLIVEDSDPDVALELALASLPGVEIRYAKTGIIAQKALREGAVAALVTDLNMPQMDGFDLIAWARSQPALAAMPIVVVSGSQDPGTSDRVRTLGANAFFLKPYSPRQVRDTLESLLHGSSG